MVHSSKLVLLLIIAKGILGAWKVGTPCPISSGSRNAGAAVGNLAVFRAFAGDMHIYDGEADTWTTKDPSPSTATGFAVTNVYGTWKIHAAKDILLEYDVQFDVWTTKQAPPTPRTSHCVAASGTATFLPVGVGTDKLLEAYDIATDTWTTKAIPIRSRFHFGCSYTQDAVVVIAGSPSRYQIVDVYTPSTDSWVQKNPTPADRREIFNGMSAANGVVYTSGSYEPGHAKKFEKFVVATNTWSLLSPSPSSAFHAAQVLLSNGDVVLSHPAMSLHVYTAGESYPLPTPGTAPSPAGVSGDPVFTSFSGVQQHLNMRTGVFNILTTSTLVVNAVFEQLDTLPADENTVVTMVAVVTKTAPDTLVCVDCVASTHRCHTSVVSETATVSSVAVSANGSVITIELPTLTVELAFRNVSVASWNSSSRYPYSLWFDLEMTWTRTGLASAGLVADLMTHTDISDYEVDSGCLFAPVVKATHTVFPEAETLNKFLCGV